MYFFGSFVGISNLRNLGNLRPSGIQKMYVLMAILKSQSLKVKVWAKDNIVFWIP